MTPAAQMSQKNRHDCVAAGVRRRQFSSTASQLALLEREGEQRVTGKNCLNIVLFVKIPGGEFEVNSFQSNYW